MIEDYAPGINLTIPANLECSVIGDLLHLPALILERQQAYDAADLDYRRAAVIAAMDGLQSAVFTDPKTGQERLAMNDRERELAIEGEITMQIDVVTRKQARDTALRLLQEAKNRFEAAQLIAKLIARGNR